MYKFYTLVRFCVSVLLLFLANSLLAQSQLYTLKGKVTDESGQTLPGAVITFNSEISIATDADGNFEFRQVPYAPKYLITIQYIGYATQNITVNLNKNQFVENIKISMQPSTTQLGVVTVVGKSDAKILSETALSVSAIDVKPLQNRSVTTRQILTRTAGVRVRESGGLGNPAQISINGISGKQIKIFVDGIPLENTGLATDLNNLPVNLIERIEVYKGILPVSLGSDALGGAINIITNKSNREYYDISFEQSSFNTSRASFNSRIKFNDSPVFVGFNGYYNYSNNNYKVRVEVPNQFGQPDTVVVPRFHDRFKSFSYQAEAGVRNETWADLFLFNFSYSGYDKELQHSFFSMNRVFGDAVVFENGFKQEIQYQKNNLFAEGLDVNLYTGFYDNNTSFIDTGLNKYNWRGDVINRVRFGSEVGFIAHTLKINSINLIQRANINYKLNPKHQFNLNLVNSYVRQDGRDSTATRLLGTVRDLYEQPQKIFKLTTGLSYQLSLLEDRLQFISAIKYYRINVDANESTLVFIGPKARYKKSNYGISQAAKFSLLDDKLLLKSNFEYTTRLPDQFELLGDQVFVAANPLLQPEISYNYNVGLQTSFDGKLGKLNLEVNGFSRDTRRNIFLLVTNFFAQHQNIAKIRANGLDAEISYNPIQIINLKLNVTYQDIRNRSDTIGEGLSTTDPRFFNKRLPNRPSLFGNAEVTVFYPSIFKSGDVASFYWNANYVRKFFLAFEEDGDIETKLTIPNQFLNTVGFSYSLPKSTISTSFEVQNLFNRDSFDNFKIQKPGRSFHLKLRYFINKTT